MNQEISSNIEYIERNRDPKSKSTFSHYNIGDVVLNREILNIEPYKPNKRLYTLRCLQCGRITKRIYYCSYIHRGCRFCSQHNRSDRVINYYKDLYDIKKGKVFASRFRIMSEPTRSKTYITAYDIKRDKVIFQTAQKIKYWDKNYRDGKDWNGKYPEDEGYSPF